MSLYASRTKKFKKIKYQGARTSARLGAAIIDLFYVTLFVGVFYFLAEDLIMVLAPKNLKVWEKILIFTSIILLFHNFIYAPIAESRGKTPGKTAMGLKIVNNDDRNTPPGSQNFLRALLRFIFYTPLFATLLVREKYYLIGASLFIAVPYLWHFFDRERQTLIDIWSSIIILERVEEPSSKTAETMRQEEVPSIWEQKTFRPETDEEEYPY